MALTACVACEGTISPEASEWAAGAPVPRSPNGQPAAGSGAPTCRETRAAPAPLARLTNREYRHTVADLFPELSLPELSLPPDHIVEGFDNNARAQTPSPALIEAYRASAQAIALALTDGLAEVVPCPTSSEAASCGSQFLDELAPRVYRRPLEADERARLLAFFEQAHATHGFASAIGMAVQALLQTPQFLYRIELGEAPAGGSAALSPYELASRLSYFFWDTMPDDALLAAAASGELDTRAGVEVQARRLLADPRARLAVASFHHQWLRFDEMDQMRKSESLFPSWNAAVAAALRESTARFVDQVFWERDGSLDALLTERGAFVNDDIAAILGVEAPGGSELVWRETNPAQRSGILTQPGLLAGFAHETTDSPVLRGVFVMDRFFCMPPSPPPPGVTGSVTEGSSDSSVPMTTRDRFALTHESGACASCHHAIDGFGFGFSHYDAVGAWRDTENGLPIDAGGWISNTQDADGEFDGAVELAQRMASSVQVRRCVSEQWLRYALGSSANDVDACDVAEITSALEHSGGDMREILISAVTSDAFRRRPELRP